MASTDKTKLDGIAAGANAYTHPANHPASIITQDASNRFVTDTEKATWNAGVVPTGVVLYFARSTPPANFLKCNGAAVSRTTYAALFAVVGVGFGAGDGSTTFNLPDLRAEFIRGADDGRGIDSGRTLGSLQMDEFKSHTHQLDTMGVAGGVVGIVQEGFHGGSGKISSGTTPSGGIETRPRNVALLACIKY